MPRFNHLTISFLLKVTVICLLIQLHPIISNCQDVVNQNIEDTENDGRVFWIWIFLGKLHPMLVHFPLSLIIVAGIMEVARWNKFNSTLRITINWMVYIGSCGALIATVLGLLLAKFGNYSGNTLEWHQWTGIGTTFISIITALLLWLITKHDLKYLIPIYKSMLILAVVSIFIVGHYGATLTHGKDYLLSSTPWGSTGEDILNMKEGLSTEYNFASIDSLSTEQELSLNLSVRAILAHHCFQCHSSDKTEGKLRLDQKEFVFNGGASGPIIIPGNARQSELMRRITLPPGHKEAMPGKGKPLSVNDINTIKIWIDKGAPWPDQAKGIFRVAPLAPRKPELPPAVAGRHNPVDRLVNAYFVNNNIKWPEITDDRTYLRRIYFDILGLPPTEEQLLQFEHDKKVNKREWAVEDLLSNNHAYAMHWATFWNDLLRNDYTGTGYITQGRFNISAWLYKSLLNNKSYNQLVMELINPTEESKGFIKGISWRGNINSSQTVAMQAAQNVSQALLGVNLKCASCHDSFVSDWKLDDAYAFANIFSEEQLEINRCDIPTSKLADTRILWPELGTIVKNATVAEKSQQLSVLLTKPENGRIYRTLVNRIWAQLMGRGIVAPTDEMDRKPWSEDLLDWMAVNFVEDGYDIKKLLYLIMTSKTYQLSSVTIIDPNTINNENFIFEGFLKRKLTAEQFADAVGKLVYPIYTQESVKYNPFINTDELMSKSNFVRAALVQNDPFQTSLGRPSRENITSVRDGQSTLLQAMELTNGNTLNQALVNASKEWVLKFTDPDLLIKAAYSKLLNRMPSQNELKIAKKIFGENVDETAVQELLWAIIMLPEFQFIE